MNEFAGRKLDSTIPPDRVGVGSAEAIIAVAAVKRILLL